MVVVVVEEREVHISLTHLFLIPQLITPDRARRGSEDVQPHIELQQKNRAGLSVTRSTQIGWIFSPPHLAAKQQS